MTEIVRIPFKGDELMATLVDGRPHILLKPAVEALGLDYSGQLQKLKGKSWAGMGLISTPSAGGVQQSVVVDVRTLLMLLATIDENRVAAHARPKLIAYQAEVADVIERHFTAPVPAPRAEVSRRELAEMVIAEADRADAAEAKVAELAPAATSWNVLASGAGDYSVADAAKILARDPHIKIGQTRLFTVLREIGWCFRQPIDQRHRPYQSAIETGRLSEIPQSHYHPRTGALVVDPPQLRITVKGLQWLHRHLGGAAELALPESSERRAVTS